MKRFLALLLLFFMPFVLVAQEAAEAVSNIDVFNSLLEVLKGWGTNPWYVTSSLVITGIVLLLKSPLAGGWFSKLGALTKRCVIGLLGLASSMIIMFGQGMPLNNVLWTTLIVSGGSVLIFELVISVIPDSWVKVKSVFNWLIKVFKKK